MVSGSSELRDRVRWLPTRFWQASAEQTGGRLTAFYFVISLQLLSSTEMIIVVNFRSSFEVEFSL